MKSMAITTIPLPVRRILKKLGEDIANARKRRRIATATMAQRANISRPTLLRLEHGDAGVSLGIFATVLFILGMQDRLADLVDASHDRVGLDLQAESLPQRIYGPRPRRSTNNEGTEASSSDSFHCRNTSKSFTPT
jgi:transcriptional regulator with XRE-family HTH domain